MSADDVAGLLGLADPRAIGSKSGRFNKLFSSLNIRTKSVYNNPRGADGQRRWIPGKQIGDALTAIALLR